jgi:peroxiredoxin
MTRFLSAGILALLLGACATTDPTSSPAAAGTATGPDYRKSRADVVVLSFFDMYCHKCQTAASHVNKLHALSRQQGADIEFYAIGWGNTPLESEMYRKRYNIPFHIVPDRSLAISRRFGKFRPPLLIALRKEGGEWREFYRVSDVRNKADSIFATIKP